MRFMRVMAAFVVAAGFFAAHGTALSGATPYAGARDPVELATSTGASYNWAGYVADAGPYTAVSATWVVPSVTTQAPLAADATWVGIGGVKTRDLIQAGTQALVQSDGTTQYEAWYEVLPGASQALPIAISSGDSVSVALTNTGAMEWHISFVDNTSGARYALDVTCTSSLSSAEWVQEMPSMDRGDLIPLDNFGLLEFTGAGTVKDGRAESPSQAGATPLRMISAAGDTLAQPSTLSEAGDFTVMRTDVVASAKALFPAHQRRP